MLFAALSVFYDGIVSCCIILQRYFQFLTTEIKKDPDLVGVGSGFANQIKGHAHYVSKIMSRLAMPSKNLP